MKKQEALPIILHVSTPDSWRGGEQQLYYLMEELNNKGLQQFLICNQTGELYKRAKAKSWEVIGKKKKSGMDLGFAYQIKHLCKSLSINCIHTHDSQAHTLALLSTVIFKNSTPIIASRRVDFPIGQSIFSRYKYNHPVVAKIICVSDAIQAIMKPSIRQKSKLCTIHSGINLDRFQNIAISSYLREEFAVPNGYQLIGNVSAIAPHKDYFTFVNTAEILIEQGVKVKFFIIGDGPEKEAIVNYVEEKKLQSHIYFTGFLENILPVLKSLDAMLISSKTEGLGTTILDAFACEVPVVATKAGGIPEIVQHQKTGLTAEVGDARKLAQCLTLLLQDETVKSSLVKNAKELLQQFSREHTASKTLKVYRDIVR